MSERTFRAAARKNGCCRQNGQQIFLTEGDFAEFLETLKPCHKRSARGSGRITTRSGKSGTREGRTRSKTQTQGQSSAKEISTARAAIHELCAKTNVTA